MDEKILYRYNGDSSFSGMSCTKYKIISETPCGYWVKSEYDYCNDDNKKWVSKTGKKRLCYPTKKEAINNLMHRRLIYLKILRSGIEKSNQIICECKKLLDKENRNQ